VSLKRATRSDLDAPISSLYTRFSTAGNRLLVLTAQQFAYVIDVDALSSFAVDRVVRSLDMQQP